MYSITASNLFIAEINLSLCAIIAYCMMPTLCDVCPVIKRAATRRVSTRRLPVFYQRIYEKDLLCNKI